MTKDERGCLVLAALCAVMAFLLIYGAGCGNQYVAAYKSLASVRAVASETELALSDVCRAKTLRATRPAPLPVWQAWIRG
jgi:hypothetical protein